MQSYVSVCCIVGRLCNEITSPLQLEYNHALSTMYFIFVSLFFRLSSTVVDVFALLHVTNRIALEAKRHVLCIQLQRAFVLFRVLTKLLVHPFIVNLYLSLLRTRATAD